MSEDRSFKVRYLGPGRVNYAFGRNLYRGDAKPLWHNFYESFEIGVPGGHRDEIDKGFMAKLKFFLDRPQRFHVNTTGMGKAYNAKSKTAKTVEKVKDVVKKVTAPKDECKALDGCTGQAGGPDRPECYEDCPTYSTEPAPPPTSLPEEEKPASKPKGKVKGNKKARGGKN